MTTPSIAILRPGTFTDIRGTKVTFTHRDLEEIAGSYDPVRDPAPLVVGHPTTDAPAYGWVDRMEVDGVHLRAHPARIAPAFAEAVIAGHYAKVSPQLYPPSSPANPKPGRWYLQHVGFLGAAAPAIKGMGTVAFGQLDRRGAVTVALDRERAHGRAVQESMASAHARARELQDQNPGLSFWAAFTRARTEPVAGRSVSFAAPAGYTVDDRNAQLHARAKALQSLQPSLSFWDAFQRAQGEPSLFC